MRENNVEYSEALSFHVGNTVADIGVKSQTDLHEGDVIATIPKQACLTVLTSEAREIIAEAEFGGGLGLAIALMYERSLGVLSKWYGYLQLLPSQQCLPFVWTLSEIDRLLVGTELHKVGGPVLFILSLFLLMLLSKFAHLLESSFKLNGTFQWELVFYDFPLVVLAYNIDHFFPLGGACADVVFEFE